MGFRPPTTRRAFTLVEVLIALAILAIGLVALLQLHVLSLRAADRAARQDQAVRLAADKLAECLAKPRLEGAAGVAGDDEPATGMEWRVTTRDVNSADLDGMELPGLIRVVVDVSWTDGPRERKVSLATYVLNRQ